MLDHLSLLIFLPAIFGVLNLLLPLPKKTLSLISAAISLVLVMALYQHPMITITHEWIPTLFVKYSLSLDKLSFVMCLMTAIVTPLALLISGREIKNPKIFYSLFLFLQTGLYGTFLASDLFLFYFFWEIVLIPVLFITGIWGGINRKAATIKFFIYTLAGSLFMLLGVIYLLVTFKTGDLQMLKIHLQDANLPWIFWAFTIAFFIKVPLFPLHTWQPALYKEAPFMGSIYLSALMAKMGTYGLLRFSVGLFPQTAHEQANLILWIATLSILYGALAAWSTKDLKKFIAYASLSHGGYIVLGIFTISVLGSYGATMQMFNHALFATSMFLIAYFLEVRFRTNDLSTMGGLAKVVPWLAIAFFIVTLSSVSLPATNSFVGEFAILMAAYKVNRAVTVVAGLGIILGAIYSLNAFKISMLGKSHPEHAIDLKKTELLAMAFITLLIFILGVNPSLLLR